MKTQKTISLKEHGIMPNIDSDTGSALQKVINSITKMQEAITLDFEPGKYHFYAENSNILPYYMSNTGSETEVPDLNKHIGIFLKNMNNICINGNGAVFVFHGKMTTICIDGCTNISLKNFSIDFYRPTMSEMAVSSIGENYIDFKVHPDSWYSFKDGTFKWVGEGFEYTGGPAQQYNPANNTIWRGFNPVEEAEKIEEISPNNLRFYFSDMPKTKQGYVFQMRNGIRDEVGMFINHSKNVELLSLNIHYMHGLGILGQYSENLTFRGIEYRPLAAFGRTASTFADSIHLSGCKGDVEVDCCSFEGAHDDFINVHGTYLEICEIIDSKHIVAEFKHSQTYGFDAFFKDDEIALVKAETYEPYLNTKITSAKLIEPRKIEIETSDEIDANVCTGWAVENKTWTPNVNIHHCYFMRSPTRGVLVSASGKVIIEKNYFNISEMSAVLIAGDVGSWYESGPVKDVTIADNIFFNCFNPAILIWPECTDISGETCYHRNINIIENMFISNNRDCIVKAKSVENLRMEKNRVQIIKGCEEKPQNILESIACKNITESNY